MSAFAPWVRSWRRTSLKMFVISGFVAGMGGALAAISTQVVGLDSISFELSTNALVMLVLGGIGTLYGAISRHDPFHGIRRARGDREVPIG